MFYKETEFWHSKIGRIPTGWEVKTLIDIVGGRDDMVVAGPFGSNLKVVDYREEGVPIIRLQNIEYGKFVNKNIKYTSLEKAEELSYHSFVKGDIVLAKLGDPIGKTCIVPDFLENGIVVADVVRIRVEESRADKRYVMQVLNSRIVSSQLSRRVIGTTRPRVNLGQVRELLLPVSPISEQRVIAEVLSCVDLAIEKTDEVIAKTERLKKGLMQQLLTKGIGHKEFKDTKIGRIPETWQVKRLKELCETITKGTTPTTLGFRYEDSGVNFIKVESIDEYGNFISEKIPCISEEADKALSRSVLKENDILFSIAGALGRVALVTKEILPANVNQALAIIRLQSYNYPMLKYLIYYLGGIRVQNHIRTIAVQSAQANLTLAQVADFNIAVPPLDENHKIVDILLTVDRKLILENNSKRRMVRAKQGLMELLLSGKVRVRVD